MSADGTAGQGRRPDGQERQRLRPAPPVRRFARHARDHRRGRAAHSTGACVRAMVRAARSIRSICVRRLHRPASMLWDGTTTWLLLDGHPARRRRRKRGWRTLNAVERAAAAERADPSLVAAAGRARVAAVRRHGPFVASDRRRCRASTVAAAAAGRATRVCASSHARLKAAFDPTGRLAPGRSVARREPVARRRRARRVRAVRAVPAALPDVPGHRRGVGVAARSHRADAPGAVVGRARRRRVRGLHGRVRAVPRLRDRVPRRRAVRPAHGRRHGTRWSTHGRATSRGGGEPATARSADHALVLAGSTALGVAQRAVCCSAPVAASRAPRRSLPVRRPGAARDRHRRVAVHRLRHGRMAARCPRGRSSVSIEAAGAAVALPSAAGGAGCCGALRVHAGLVEDAAAHGASG